MILEGLLNCLENKIFQTHLVPVALYQVTYISFRFFKKKMFCTSA